jgi:hypothetical protein
VPRLTFQEARALANRLNVEAGYTHDRIETLNSVCWHLKTYFIRHITAEAQSWLWEEIGWVKRLDLNTLPENLKGLLSALVVKYGEYRYGDTLTNEDQDWLGHLAVNLDIVVRVLNGETTQELS